MGFCGITGRNFSEPRYVQPKPKKEPKKMHVLVDYSIINKYGASEWRGRQIVKCHLIDDLTGLLAQPGKIIGIHAFRILSEEGVRISKVIDMLHDYRVKNGDLEICDNGLILLEGPGGSLRLTDLRLLKKEQHTIETMKIADEMGLYLSKIKTKQEMRLQIAQWADRLIKNHKKIGV